MTEETATPAPAPRVERPSTSGAYNLRRLEQLVHESELRGDPESEEWAYYLPLLREHSDVDGNLPVQFDSLVYGVFGDSAASA